MTHYRSPHDDSGIPTLTVRQPEHDRPAEDKTEPASAPDARSTAATYPEPVLRAALQAAIEDAVDEALDEAIVHLRTRLQDRLPEIVTRALRQTRSG
ncbi:MAG: hypothetical protein JHC61_09940 [Burkholderiaceae bacterium]|nr:hypothetical protein [Burkholderiaceae bacterium]